MTPQLPDLSNVPDLPPALSLLIVFFLLTGSLFTFIGALGLAFFRNFYDRLHMPSLGTTLGAISILLSTSIYTSYINGHIILRDALIIFFISLVAPISIMMLSRAAAMRDLTKNWYDTSDNMFWRLITDETDAQVEKTVEKQERQEEWEEQAEAAAQEKQRAGAEEKEKAAAETLIETAKTRRRRTGKTARRRNKNTHGS